MKNTNTITLVLTEIGLKRFNTIPTFNRLLHPNQIKGLKVGKNLITVNNTCLGRLSRLSDNHILITKLTNIN
jgi:hypothetical protein